MAQADCFSSRSLSRCVGDHPILSGTACVVYGHPSHAIANGVKLRGQLVGVVVRSYNCGSVEVTGVLNTTRRAICRTRRSSKPDHPQRTGPAGAVLWTLNVRHERRVAGALFVRRVFIPVAGRPQGNEPACGERLRKWPEKAFAEAPVKRVHLRPAPEQRPALGTDDDADESRRAAVGTGPSIHGDEVERGGCPREGRGHGARGRRDDARRERLNGRPARRDGGRQEPLGERRVGGCRCRADFVIPVRRRRRRRARGSENGERDGEGGAAHGRRRGRREGTQAPRRRQGQSVSTRTAGLPTAAAGKEAGRTRSPKRVRPECARRGRRRSHRSLCRASADTTRARVGRTQAVCQTAESAPTRRLEGSSSRIRNVDGGRGACANAGLCPGRPRNRTAASQIRHGRAGRAAVGGV